MCYKKRKKRIWTAPAVKGLKYEGIRKGVKYKQYTAGRLWTKASIPTDCLDISGTN